ncbi:MAG: hypothetical protein ACLQVA_01175 [Candidatus Brocadiia bacterium]
MTSIEAQIKEMADRRRDAAEKLRFFDAGIWLGEPTGFPLAHELSPDGLGAALKGRCITGGLVSHWHGKTVSAQDGNEALTRALEGRRDEVYATWTALPLLPGEGGRLPGAGPLPGQVKATRIFPKTHNFPLTSWCIGGLSEWLASRRMPLFIWHTELDWKSMYELARAFPKQEIVVETQTQKILYHTRPLFALMRDCRNVRVELSNFAGQGFIEYAVREFGAERLIFGSFLPVNDPLVPIGMVLDAKISEAEKALIAGGNLRRIVNEVTP